MKLTSQTKFKTILFQVSAILILIAAVAFSLNTLLAKILIIVGVSGYGAVVFTTPYPGKGLRGKRLHNMQIFSVLLLAVSAYLMCVERMEWVIILLIAAILILYSTTVISIAYKQEQKQDEEDEEKNIDKKY